MAAGPWARGIAQLCAQSGYQVVVSEINDELLKRGLGSIDKTLAEERGEGQALPAG